MIFLKKCFVNTTKDVDVVPITHDVKYALRDSEADEGLVTVVASSPGAALLVVEPVDEVIAELKEAFKMFPGEGKEATTRRKESVTVGARVRAAMIGKSVSLPFADGKPLIGLREEVVLIDFENTGRRREYAVQVMGEGGGEEPQGGFPLGMMGGEE